MCGIAGSINNPNIDIKKIQQSLKHRGPNDYGSFCFENSCLIHTRLSIMDLSHGKQPFIINEFVIVFNGEIYNHLSIRKKYLNHINFKTNSDSETLLHLYIHFKEKIFDYLDGMFAFAILNQKTKTIFLATDKSGKKPLYIYHKDDKVFFASELNTIKQSVKLEIDEEKINTFLRVGYFPFGITPYKYTNMLYGGEYATINLQSPQIKKEIYFDLLDIYKKDKLDLSIKDTIDLVEKALNQSIKNRLISSDIEVGAFLSGGIDSSLIVALASKMGYKLRTFTVRFENSSFDESPLANLVAKKYNTNHHLINIKMNLKDDIEKILLNYGEPFMDSSAIPSYYVSLEAKKYLSVILSGDGADELFGGYRRYVASNNLNIFKKLSFFLNLLPISKNKHSIISHLNRLNKLLSKKDLDYYLSSTTDVFEDIIQFKDTQYINKMQLFTKKINSLNLSHVDKMLYMDFKFILFNDLLKKMDIASMANSLEVRSPFLSQELLNIVPRIQTKYKIKNITTKYILRELAKKHIPKQLVKAPKRGFEVPLSQWVQNELKDNIMDSLSNGYHLNFIKKKQLDDIINNTINISDNQKSKILWSIFSLNTWHKHL